MPLTITQEDREAAAEAVEHARPIFADEIRAGRQDDYQAVQAFARHRIQALEAAAKRLQADAQLCDCHAHSEGECVCGAWYEWKTVPMHRAVEIVRTLIGGEA